MGFFHPRRHHEYFVNEDRHSKVCKSKETINASEETREQKELRKKHHHHVLFKALVLPPVIVVGAAVLTALVVPIALVGGDPK